MTKWWTLEIEMRACMDPGLEIVPCKVMHDSLNLATKAIATSSERAMTIRPNAFNMAG